MIYALLFYWIVAGVAMWAQPSKSCGFPGELVILFFCLLFGGICMPAKLLAKMVS